MRSAGGRSEVGVGRTAGQSDSWGRSGRELGWYQLTLDVAGAVDLSPTATLVACGCALSLGTQPEISTAVTLLADSPSRIVV
jgi:hypothetical protein